MCILILTGGILIVKDFIEWFEMCSLQTMKELEKGAYQSMSWTIECIFKQSILKAIISSAWISFSIKSYIRFTEMPQWLHFSNLKTLFHTYFHTSLTGLCHSN